MPKPRSRYGKFLDDNGIEQKQICNIAKLGRDTLTRVCNSDAYPSGNTMRKLIEAARMLTGKDVKQDDFWPM